MTAHKCLLKHDIGINCAETNKQDCESTRSPDPWLWLEWSPGTSVSKLRVYEPPLMQRVCLSKNESAQGNGLQGVFLEGVMIDMCGAQRWKGTFKSKSLQAAHATGDGHLMSEPWLA